MIMNIRGSRASGAGIGKLIQEKRFKHLASVGYNEDFYGGTLGKMFEKFDRRNITDLR